MPSTKAATAWRIKNKNVGRVLRLSPPYHISMLQMSSISSFLWIFTRGSAGRRQEENIFQMMTCAAPHVRRSPPNVVPVIDYFPSKNVLKETFITPRSYCLSVQENDHLYHKLDRIASLDQNPLNLNHVHDQDQDNPCLVNVIPLLRLKCALLLTISLATVSFKLSMFLHLCAIIASTYSLLVTLLRRLPNVNFLLSTKLSLSYQKCTPHYVRTV